LLFAGARGATGLLGSTSRQDGQDPDAEGQHRHGEQGGDAVGQAGPLRLAHRAEVDGPDQRNHDQARRIVKGTLLHVLHLVAGESDRARDKFRLRLPTPARCLTDDLQ
jgi:hypothetical protein